ncbi:MAG: glutamate--tRNA ligase [candidate division Zixibacteria bacterium]|nr:glutamate--tRNA ligase [candidate division Zixibacteria bacterium]
MSDNVVTRIAPSPSGFLHVGTARTAIFNYLFARHNDGKLLFRMEDTDPERSKEEWKEAIINAMKWLKLDWDGEIIYQSQRIDIYKEYALKLQELGNAYYCYCTPDELEAKRKKALEAKEFVGYDRKCLHLSEERRQELDAKGVPKALRIKTPHEGLASFSDIVGGDLTRDYLEMDDWVIMRSDGRCTYNFCCVVDDHLMGITHVIRGNDHIINTFRQCTVYDRFGWDRPNFAHIPLILGKDRSKISKRHGAVSVMDYDTQGILPEAMFNFLSLLGWAPGDDREIMTRQELIDAFTLERVTGANPIFDPVKLEWMNAEYIRNMDDNEILDRVRWVMIDAGLTTRLSVEAHWHWMLQVVRLLKERVKTLRDFPTQARYFFTDEYEYDEKGERKHFSDSAVIALLIALRDEFSGLSDGFGEDEIEKALRSLAERLEMKPAKLIHPTRLALTGLTGGPGLFELMHVLGKEKCIARLDRAIEYLEEKFS